MSEEKETKPPVGSTDLLGVFDRDGFYAIQNWVSYGSVERIIYVENGLAMVAKGDWVSAEGLCAGMTSPTVVFLPEFEPSSTHLT